MPKTTTQSAPAAVLLAGDYEHYCPECERVVGCRDLLGMDNVTVHYGRCGHEVALSRGKVVYVPERGPTPKHSTGAC